jgi:hypothetical protein
MAEVGRPFYVIVYAVCEKAAGKEEKRGTNVKSQGQVLEFKRREGRETEKYWAGYFLGGKATIHRIWPGLGFVWAGAATDLGLIR